MTASSSHPTSTTEHLMDSFQQGLSMATGEALLALTDGGLDGVLPFRWTRVYRTNAVDIDCGLGFGWSHGLCHFSDSGLTSICDAYNNRLCITRDVLGRIQRLENDAGRALMLRYDRGHIVAVDYQVQRTEDHRQYMWATELTLVTYRYDEHWRLVSATNAVGEREHYRYDDQHRMVQRQLAGGASFFWAWEPSDKAARCVRRWASFAQVDTQYAWGENGRVTVQDADSSAQTYIHDQNGRLVQRIDQSGAHHYKSYDEQGRLTIEQDPLGAVTAYQYDEVGQLIALFPGNDEPTSYEYHNDFLRSERRGDTCMEYLRNHQGDITRQTDPSGNVTHYSYDRRGKLTAVCYPDQRCLLLSWNHLGQLTLEQLPDGGVRRFRYDILGRRITRENEQGALTQYEWDDAGRLALVVLPNADTRKFSYNAYGKITAERDELGRVTRYEYANGLPLVSRCINPDGTQRKYRYDNAHLRLTEIENEAGEKYRRRYYANGLIQQEIDFDGRRTTYRYDLNRNLLEKAEYADDDNRLITRYERDTAGRAVRKTLPNGNIFDYTYDRSGRLTNISWTA